MSHALVIVDVQNRYDHVVATLDHHIDPGGHFSAEPDCIDSWPVHCVVGTPGAEFHPGLDTARIERVVDKGEYAAAYSGFEGSSEGRDLEQWLHDLGVDTVTGVGLATDHCVRATAIDAALKGFATAGAAGPDRRCGVAQYRTGAGPVTPRRRRRGRAGLSPVRPSARATSAGDQRRGRQTRRLPRRAG